MGQTGSGKDWDLLSSGDAVHGIDGRDTSLNHLLRVDTRPGVDRLSCMMERESVCEGERRRREEGEDTGEHVVCLCIRYASTIPKQDTVHSLYMEIYVYSTLANRKKGGERNPPSMYMYVHMYV